jgi:hypothetical protein
MQLAARQLMRAIRGHRSQVAFSRRLGYRGNVAAKWEGGHRFPTFGEMLRASSRTGVDVAAALVRFHAPSAALWNPKEPEVIHPWLASLRGQSSQTVLAERSGLSRQQVGRMLSGRAQGRLPQVLTLLHTMTGRMPDLIGHLVPIGEVPAIAKEAEARRALARLAFAHPWSPAARAWLGTQGRVPVNEAPHRLAEALGLSTESARVLIDALVTSGAAREERNHLRPSPRVTVEIDASSEDLQQVRAHWAQVSADRMARGAPGDLFSFNVFAVGREDLIRIQEAQRRFYREVRAIVADSPPEVPAMLVVHTAAWTD